MTISSVLLVLLSWNKNQYTQNPVNNNWSGSWNHSGPIKIPQHTVPPNQVEISNFTQDINYPELCKVEIFVKDSSVGSLLLGTIASIKLVYLQYLHYLHYLQLYTKCYHCTRYLHQLNNFYD